SRLEVCATLRQHQMPCVAWFEDVLYYFGVPTCLFDLYILVPDIDRAAKVLQGQEWALLTTVPARIGNSLVQLRQHLASELVLLSAEDWGFPFTGKDHHVLPKSTSQPFFPNLSDFLDSLIGKWLDTSADGTLLWSHLACHIAYLNEHALPLRDGTYGNNLKYEHRQFHMDIISGSMQTLSLPFLKHERSIREALRRGEYTIRKCSAS
ncbi:hypothetical protein EJ08DRAFT_550397, partial [Tothia fuscella]